MFVLCFESDRASLGQKKLLQLCFRPFTAVTVVEARKQVPPSSDSSSPSFVPVLLMHAAIFSEEVSVLNMLTDEFALMGDYDDLFAERVSLWTQVGGGSVGRSVS